MIQPRCFWSNYFLNNWSLLDGLLTLVCLLMVHSHFYHDHQPAECRYIFWWHMLFNSSFYIASHGAPINCSFWIFLFSFLFRLFSWSTWFRFVLILKSSVICSVPNLFSNFWLFLVLFWMLWRLVTVNKLCHVPHASRITTWETVFTKIFFAVSKEWVRSWSHASKVTNLKTLAKKLLAVPPKIALGIRKRERTRIAIPKRFALHANAEKVVLFLTSYVNVENTSYRLNAI